MRPYGINRSDAVRHPSPYGMDTADVQSALPKGVRIRNKKQKRRSEKKKTRQQVRLSFLSVELMEV